MELKDVGANEVNYTEPCDTSSDYLKKHTHLEEWWIIQTLERSAKTVSTTASETNVRLDIFRDTYFSTRAPHMDVENFFKKDFLGYLLSRNRERIKKVNPSKSQREIDVDGMRDLFSSANIAVLSSVFGKSTTDVTSSNYKYLSKKNREMQIPLFIVLEKSSPFDESINHLLDLAEESIRETPGLGKDIESIHTKMATLLVQKGGVERNEKLIKIVDEFYDLMDGLDGIGNVLKSFRSMALTLERSEFIKTLASDNGYAVFSMFNIGVRYPDIDSDNRLFEKIYEDVEKVTEGLKQLPNVGLEIIQACRKDVPRIHNIIKKGDNEKDTVYVKRLRSMVEKDVWSKKQIELRGFLETEKNWEEIDKKPELVLEKINQICGIDLTVAYDERELDNRQQILTKDAAEAILGNRNPRLVMDMDFLKRRTQVLNPNTNNVEEWAYLEGGLKSEVSTSEAETSGVRIENLTKPTREQYDVFLDMMAVVNRG